MDNVLLIETDWPNVGFGAGAETFSLIPPKSVPGVANESATGRSCRTFNFKMVKKDITYQERLFADFYLISTLDLSSFIIFLQNYFNISLKFNANFQRKL